MISALIACTLQGKPRKGFAIFLATPRKKTARSGKIIYRATELTFKPIQAALAPALHLLLADMVELRLPLWSVALEYCAYMLHGGLGSGDIKGKVAEQAFIQQAHAVVNHPRQA